MSKIHVSFARAAWAALLVPALSFGAIGKVVAVEGTAWRVPGGTEGADATEPPALDESKKVPLAEGTEIDVGDNVLVDASSNVKLALNDESVLALGEHSHLWVNKANFENLDHRAFSAKLWFGKVWAKVNKALSGSDAKFEVTTPRAVAGVRGTIFRIDAVKIFSAASKPHFKHTVIKVAEGKVAVEAKVKKGAGAPGSTPGPRHQVAGPSQISADAWEKLFVELQGHQEIDVDELASGGPKARPYDPGAEKDAFASFIVKHP